MKFKEISKTQTWKENFKKYTLLFVTRVTLRHSFQKKKENWRENVQVEAFNLNVEGNKEKLEENNGSGGI